MPLLPLKRLRRCFAAPTVPALVLVVVGLATTPVSAAIVTVTNNYLEVAVQDSTLGGSSTADSSTALNRTNTITTTYGGSSSSTTLDWSGNDDFAVLDFAFSHQRAGSLYSYAKTEDSYRSGVTFVANQNTIYALSGNYGMTGRNRIYSSAYLSDVTDPTNGIDIFYDYSESYNSPNEQFTLGAPGDGDNLNGTYGSLTGTLLAGHTYVLRFSDFIQAYPGSDNGATASGFLRLEIGNAPTASVPEPVSLLTWAGLGVLGLAGGVVRRRMLPRIG